MKRARGAILTLSGLSCLAALGLMWLPRGAPAVPPSLPTHERAKHPAARASRSAASAARPHLQRDQKAAVPSPSAPLSLAALERTPERERLLFEAEEQAVADCMAKRGFAYTPVRFEGDAREELAFERVESDDVEAASAVGYELASTLERAQEPGADALPADPSRDLPPAQRARYEDSLFGPDPAEHDVQHDARFVSVTTSDGATLIWVRDACLSVARRAIYGDDDVAQRKLELSREDLLNELERRAERAQVHQEAVQRWQGCMRAAGHLVDAPGDPADALADDYRAGRLNLEELRDREREVAELDARCARDAGLRTARVAARELEAPALAQSHAALIEQWRASDEAAAARASRIRPPVSDDEDVHAGYRRLSSK